MALDSWSWRGWFNSINFFGPLFSQFFEIAYSISPRKSSYTCLYEMDFTVHFSGAKLCYWIAGLPARLQLTIKLKDWFISPIVTHKTVFLKDQKGRPQGGAHLRLWGRRGGQRGGGGGDVRRRLRWGVLRRHRHRHHGARTGPRWTGTGKHFVPSLDFVDSDLDVPKTHKSGSTNNNI